MWLPIVMNLISVSGERSFTAYPDESTESLNLIGFSAGYKKEEIVSGPYRREIDNITSPSTDFFSLLP